jgi:hypothetical protein
MSIDLQSDTLLSFPAASKALSVHVATLHRWRAKGVRGVRLATFLRGGRRYTTQEELARFFVATTEAADGMATLAKKSGGGQ